MIAVDTNILIYAHRADSRFHLPAAAKVRALAEGGAPWAIPWPCVHEFIGIVTHPRIYNPPSSLPDALRQIEFWMDAPGLTLLSESAGYWPVLKDVARAAGVRGPRIHDARIASICRQHGVAELWSADRDFGHHMGLRVVNPAVD